MKKFILILGFCVLFLVLGLQGYFMLVPPPEATLHRPLSEVIPSEMPGWEIKDMDMAESPESSARISDFLNFDDALFRIFQNGDAFVGLYIAYWTPGKASYRWAGAHTPDTCWVKSGWEREDRDYSVPFTCPGYTFEPAEFGIYSKDGQAQNVYFWHLVGGEAFGYTQKDDASIFGALEDIQHHGLNLRKEQFFIRLSSNKDLETLKAMPGFNAILEGIGYIMELDEVVTAASGQ